MKAIILAAGRGSRMRQLTDEQPKCLTVVHGKTLFSQQVSALRQAGITDIAVVSGYRRDVLVAACHDMNVQEFHNPEWERTNMVSSLACAADWLNHHHCIVSYSDIFYDASAVNMLCSSRADIALTYDPNWLALWQQRFSDPLSDAESFRLNARGHLLEIGKQAQSTADIEGQYMGLLRFSPQGWQRVSRLRAQLSAEERDHMHMTGTLQKLIEQHEVIHALPYHGQWGEIDSQNDLALYGAS